MQLHSSCFKECWHYVMQDTGPYPHAELQSHRAAGSGAALPALGTAKPTRTAPANTTASCLLSTVQRLAPQPWGPKQREPSTLLACFCSTQHNMSIAWLQMNSSGPLCPGHCSTQAKERGNPEPAWPGLIRGTIPYILSSCSGPAGRTQPCPQL